MSRLLASNPAPPIWGPAGYDVTSPQNPSGAALGLGKRTAFGASITSGQNILTITDGWFTAAMASGAWNVIVPDANDANKNALVTTVSGLTDAQHVTLAANAGATVAGGKAYLWPASGAGSDDGPSFIAAQAAAGAGGKVSVPSIGTSNFYPISSLSAFTKGQAMVGASQWGCALLHTGAGVFVQTVNFCQLQNLLLFAGSATTFIHRLLDGSYSDYQHVELDGEANVNTVMGLQPWNAVLNSGGDYYNRFVLINAHHCVRGLDLAVNSNGTPVVNVNTWIACQFSFNRDAGVYMGYAEGAEFWSCAAEQNGKVGSGPSSGFMGVALRLTTGAASDFRWLAGWIEGNKNGTIRWDAPVNDIEITGVINQYVSDGGGTGFLGFALGRNDLVIDSLGAASDMFAYDSRVKVTPIKAITYSAAMTPNTQDGEWQTIAVTNGTAFTINAPSNPPLNSTNRRLVIEVFNNSGGAMGVITWNGAFVFAGLVWANPATTKRRFVSFDYNGANWIATAMSTADY